MVDANALIGSLSDIDAQSFANDDQRAHAVLAVKELLERIQKPFDNVYRLTWQEPAYVAALKIATDVDLFTKWVASGGGPKTVPELVALSGIEEALLVRLLRHMSAMKGLKEPAQGTYALTPFTQSLAGPGNKSCFPLMYDATYPAFLHLPLYLAKNGYKNPTDTAAGNWQDLKGTPETYIQHIGADAGRAANFQDVMVAYAGAKNTWVDFYPTGELFGGDVQADDRPVVIVDVGGGKGQDMVALRQKHPDRFQAGGGSIVLQDLPQVTDAMTAPDGITLMAHDLFTPQPVKGARAYFMHIVLHGFSNEDGVKVLRHLADAMEPGYSRLLLHEKVIADREPTPDVTSMDLTMMATLSARERSQAMWHDMLAEAGLRVVKIYNSPAMYEAIIEAEKA